MSSDSSNRYANPSIPLEELFQEFMPDVDEPLKLLLDDELYAGIIGRSRGTHREYGHAGTLYAGMICEGNSEHFGRKVLVDALNPHKLFICGKTGSGKSYTVGVLAEELAAQQLGIGTIIVDPMGTFWCMKYAKKTEEGDILSKWGMTPREFSNIKVFVPVGLADRYAPGTFDDVFSIRPSDLIAEDWANTFGLDYFKSPQSGLIIEVTRRLREENRGPDGEEGLYSIADMVRSIDESENIDENFHASTIRAVKMRFESASQWGIFSTKGTSIQKLSKPNQVSVVDVSLLPDNSRALVVGLLAKQILDERTRIARQERIDDMNHPQGGGQSDEIPVTWLIVDEAHSLVPAKGKTAASDPLIEYAKRGRMPGCALIMATQQPSATSDEILSQVDIMISHNLSYTRDISELAKRSPSKMPRDIGNEDFIRKLPVGACLISDQTTSTSRVFVARIRPRLSEHGGTAILPTVARPSEPEAEVEQPKTIVEEAPRAEPKPEPVPEEVPEPVQVTAARFDDVKVQRLSIPVDLAEDYVNRFLSFRVAYQELDYTRVDVTTSVREGTNLIELYKYSSELEKQGYRLENVSYVDENPLIVYVSGEKRQGLTLLYTDSHTVVGKIRETTSRRRQ